MYSSLQINGILLDVISYADTFVLLRPTRKGQSLYPISQAIYDANFPYIDEVIGSEVEICLKLNNSFKQEQLRELEQLNCLVASKNSSYKLPIYFGGDHDWALIEKHSGLSKKNYLAKLLEAPLQLAMLGFLPGFLYIKGLDPKLSIPRKKTPDSKVKPGSIAIGDNYMGFYSLASPGGWNVIGLSPVKVLDTTQLPAININVGDTLIPYELSRKTYQALQNTPLTLLEYNELL